MTPRALEVLNAIVKTYIDTGEPVGSRTISKRRAEPLSAASIRNVMADLAEAGYIEQPHTSAGRVPTDKAFRIYASSLHAGRMAAAVSERLRAQLRGADTVEERVERSSHLLTEMTHNVGIAAAMRSSGEELDQIELLALSDRRVLMVLVTRDKRVRNRVVTIGEPVTQPELDSIRNYVNAHFSGRLLSQARQDLLRLIDRERTMYDAMLRHLTMLCAKGLLEPYPAPEIHMEGASNLVGIDLHLTKEKLRDLLRALEEKKRLKELLDRFVEAPDGEVAVQIGLSEAHPSMKGLSLIGVSIALPGGLSTKIAVLGPMRMDYERVMSAVLGMARAFESLPI